MKFNSQNIFLGFAVILLVFAVVNFSYTIFQLGGFGVLTGFASDTGEASVTVSSSANLNFTTNSTDWGSGAVNETADFALLYTNGTIIDGGWSSNTQFLVLENIGNINVTLNFSSNKNASTFIGGTTPLFQILVNNNETNSCSNFTGFNAAYQDINASAVSCCNNFAYGTNNSLNVDIKLKIPSDATAGSKSAIITASAEAV